LALLNLNPASFVDNPSTAFIVPNTSTIRYLAILGHSGGTMYPEWRTNISWFGTSNLVQIINGQGYSSNQSVSYSGFTIWTFDDEDAQSATGFKAVSSGEKGAISIGNYYNMPNAPNLSLTMSRDYGGTKEFTTHSGSSMSNTMWSKPPKWGDLGAWELGSGNPALSRSGRRSWDLKFSYIDDGDLWGSNQSLSNIINTSTGVDGTDYNIPTAVTWTDDCENQVGSNFGYEIFDGVSKYGFHAVNTISAGRAGTKNTINITSGVTYKVTFNLSLDTSTYPLGVTPEISLKSILNGSHLTDDKQRAINGGNELIFTAHTTDATSCISFEHLYDDEDSEFTVSDIYIQAGHGDFNYNLLTDDNFFSQVWHKTLGGTLPFIFQPDSSNNNPDQFAICKFKDNSLKATQSAFNVYDISLSIEEVW